MKILHLFNWNFGDKYVGDTKYKHGSWIPHGQGSFTWTNGDKYVGEFKDNFMHGQGTYTWSGGLKFTGEWVENRKWNGTGYSQFDTVTGTFVKGKWHSAL